MGCNVVRLRFQVTKPAPHWLAEACPVHCNDGTAFGDSNGRLDLRYVGGGTTFGTHWGS